MIYTAPKRPMKQEQKDKLRKIALERGYKPPSQKGLKRISVWNKGKKAIQFQGANHGQWKGENVSYEAAHQWVRRWKGKPTHCEQCGAPKTTPWSIQWANKDHKYRRVLDDYIALCMKCHREWDKNL